MIATTFDIVMFLWSCVLNPNLMFHAETRGMQV
jgi:hypothetical protein